MCGCGTSVQCPRERVSLRPAFLGRHGMAPQEADLVGEKMKEGFAKVQPIPQPCGRAGRHRPMRCLACVGPVDIRQWNGHCCRRRPDWCVLATTGRRKSNQKKSWLMNAAPCIGALPAITELRALYFDRMAIQHSDKLKLRQTTDAQQNRENK